MVVDECSVFNDEARRRELADFLKSRRARVSPTEAGLPAGRRRRTPGLRREEVAELAGIGTTWYTWLEQARDVRPSETAIRRIARALNLDETERRYFLNIALERAPTTRAPEVVTPMVHAALDALSCPAYVKGQRWDLLAYNPLADAVFGLARAPHRNMLLNTFTEESKRLHPNWRSIAAQQVAMFRSDCAGLLKDPWVLELVDELKARSAEFREWWSEQSVLEMQSGHKTYDRPFAGRIGFDVTVLVPGDAPNLRLVLYVPDGAETALRVRELVRQHTHGGTPSVWAALRMEKPVNISAEIPG